MAKAKSSTYPNPSPRSKVGAESVKDYTSHRDPSKDANPNYKPDKEEGA